MKGLFPPSDEPVAYLTAAQGPDGTTIHTDAVHVCPEGSYLLAAPALELLWLIDRYKHPPWDTLPYRTIEALRLVGPALRR